MPSEGYKALTLRLYAAIGEVFRTGDSGLLDPLLAPDMVDHTPPSGPVIGRAPGKQLIASFARAFPDTTLTVDLMVAEGDMVAAFVSYRSTHTGPFVGHPPGKKCASQGWILCATVTGRSSNFGVNSMISVCFSSSESSHDRRMHSPRPSLRHRYTAYKA